VLGGTGVEGRIMTTDRTVAGTSTLVQSESVGVIGVVDGNLYFRRAVRADGVARHALYRTTGTPGGTAKLADVAGIGSPGPLVLGATKVFLPVEQTLYRFDRDATGGATEYSLGTGRIASPGDAVAVGDVYYSCPTRPRATARRSTASRPATPSPRS
jgi:hypothetical protein